MNLTVAQKFELIKMLENGKSDFQLKLLIYYIIVYIYSVQIFYTVRLDSVLD